MKVSSLLILKLYSSIFLRVKPIFRFTSLILALRKLILEIFNPNFSIKKLEIFDISTFGDNE